MSQSCAFVGCSLLVIVVACGSTDSAGSGNSAAGAANTVSGAAGASSSNGGGANATGGAGAAAANGGAPVSGGATANGGALPNGGATANGGTTSAGQGGGAGTGTGGGSVCPGARPDATNTGVPSGVTPTVVDQDVTITVDNTTFDSMDVHGFLIVKANNVKITRSIVRGGVATHNGDGIQIASGTGTLIEDSEVALAHPSAYLDGIGGSDVTVRRCNVHGGVDGMKVGSNSIVECNYIHDMSSFDVDPNQNGGPTHNDAIQILSGTKIRITGNQLIAAKDQNSAIQVTQDFGVVADLVVASNWADGGGCSFNFSHKGQPSLAVTANDNRFGRNSFFNCPILHSIETTLTAAGNVWDDDGTPVPIQMHD